MEEPFWHLQGIAMLSSVLSSERAIKVNIQIMRIYTKMRELLITHKTSSSPGAEMFIYPGTFINIGNVPAGMIIILGPIHGPGRQYTKGANGMITYP
jgi:hypothetical protein